MDDKTTLAVEHLTPGTLTLRLGSETITVTMSDRPRVALALGALHSALEIEARIARDGPPDFSRWRGAFCIDGSPREDIW